MVKKEEYVSHGLYIDFLSGYHRMNSADCGGDAERDQKRLDAAVHRFRRWFNEALANQQEEFGRSHGFTCATMPSAATHLITRVHGIYTLMERQLTSMERVYCAKSANITQNPSFNRRDLLP